MEESANNSNKSSNPCALVSNPLDLDLVLAKVLDYVGEHKKSLLNCRLMNHRWNSLVLLKLRKENNCFISLDPSNILECIELIKKSHQTSESLPISVRLLEYNNNQETHRRFIAGVTKLVALFGPACIENFKVSTGAFNWSEMLKLILTCSPGLQKLVIKPNHGNDNECLNPVNLAALTNNDKLPTFASLESLEFWGIAKNPSVLTQLVNSAPKLQKLYIDLNANEMGFNVRAGTNNNQRVAAAYNGFMSCRLRELYELNIVLGDDSSYQVIQAHQFPILKKLKITFNRKISEVASNLLVQFLKHKCPKLNWLHFHFNIDHMQILRNHDLVHGFPSNFPTLPNVTHFGLSYSGTELGWSYINHSSTTLEFDPPVFIQIDNLNSGNFPNLSSVTIGFGLYLYSRAGFAGFDPEDDEDFAEEFEWDNNPRLVNFVSFEKVLKLTVVFNGALEEEDYQFRHLLPTMDESCAAQQLHLLFPNVKGLVLDNQIRPNEKYVNELEEYILACLDEFSELESLTINNYIKDWFCESTSISSYVSVSVNELFQDRLQSLKTLIIPPIQKQYKEIITSNGGLFAYKRAITHAQVIVNGITLNQHNPLVDSSRGVDNNVANTIGLFVKNISTQLINISRSPEVVGADANDLYKLIDVRPSTLSSTKVHENVYILTKCLEMIEYFEQTSIVGTLAKQLIESLTALSNGKNNSTTTGVGPVTPSFNIKELMVHLPNLEQIQVGEEFLCADNVDNLIEELKITYPNLKIQLIQ